MECSDGIIYYNVNNLVALQKMNAILDIERNHLLATLQVRPSLRDQIQSVQMEDPHLKKMKEKVEAGTNSQFTVTEDGVLMMEVHMCVPNIRELRK